jgi:hypothetical protein
MSGKKPWWHPGHAQTTTDPGPIEAKTAIGATQEENSISMRALMHRSSHAPGPIAAKHAIGTIQEAKLQSCVGCAYCPSHAPGPIEWTVQSAPSRKKNSI